MSPLNTSPRRRGLIASWAGAVIAVAILLVVAIAAGHPATAQPGKDAMLSAPRVGTATSSVKVTRDWKLGPLGSGTVTLQCPTGYTVQLNAIKAPNGFGSSNSAISATPAGYNSDVVTLWVTNWNPFNSESTTLHIWCDSY